MKEATKLGRCTILDGGFLGAIELAGCGDAVYCDPPYLASAKGSSFTSYTAGVFVYADQKALVEAALLAVSRGAKVLISNHDTPLARELYRGWHLETFGVQRSLSAKAARVLLSASWWQCSHIEAGAPLQRIARVLLRCWPMKARSARCLPATRTLLR
jgi:site-specific DNA-adenine methylase